MTPCALLAAALLLAGCDALPESWGAVAEAAGATSARPEGWESLEVEGGATRLYYQYVDQQRRVRFVERLEDVPERWRASVGYVKLEAPPPLSPADAARVRQARMRRSGAKQVAGTAPSGSEIILYSADWCGACRKAKRYLVRKGIDYEERNVDVPAVADDLLRKTGRRAIPVIDVDGRILTGFSATSYDALIDRA